MLLPGFCFFCSYFFTSIVMLLFYTTFEVYTRFRMVSPLSPFFLLVVHLLSMSLFLARKKHL